VAKDPLILELESPIGVDDVNVDIQDASQEEDPVAATAAAAVRMEVPLPLQSSLPLQLGRKGAGSLEVVEDV
jgi:hypothetical protein